MSLSLPPHRSFSGAPSRSLTLTSVSSSRCASSTPATGTPAGIAGTRNASMLACPEQVWRINLTWSKLSCNFLGVCRFWIFDFTSLLYHLSLHLKPYFSFWHKPKNSFVIFLFTAIRMGRPKKSKMSKKAGKKFDQTTSIVNNYYSNSNGNSRNNNMNGEHGKGNEKYGRIPLQRNFENSYRNMYESKINSSHEYYSKTESTYSTSYPGNKLSMNAFSLPVHQNSEIYNAYHSHTDGINGRSFEHPNNDNYFASEGNPPKQYQGMRLDRELPIYHFSGSREQVPCRYSALGHWHPYPCHHFRPQVRVWY